MLQMQTEQPAQAASAALEVEMVLQEDSIICTPQLGTEAQGVGTSLLETIAHISNIGMAVKRFDVDEGAVTRILVTHKA